MTILSSRLKNIFSFLSSAKKKKGVALDLPLGNDWTAEHAVIDPQNGKLILVSFSAPEQEKVQLRLSGAPLGRFVEVDKKSLVFNRVDESKVAILCMSVRCNVEGDRLNKASTMRATARFSR